jgi:hypothetical protein
MRFRVVAEMEPSAPFGVPDGRTFVIPSGMPFQGPPFVMHDDQFILMGFNTLSRYRDTATRKQYRMGDAVLNLMDNVATVEVDVPTYHDAARAARALLDRFTRLLGVFQTRSVSYRMRVVIAETGETFPPPFVKTGLVISAYDLDRLSKDLDRAASTWNVLDERLDRAGDYFRHALYLFERRGIIAEPLSTDYSMIISAVFLNLWKAVSTVVGDPSRKLDRYQSRYRKIGLDDALKRRIDRLKDLRDGYDVAHYSLDNEHLSEVDGAVGEAAQIAGEVLQRYVDHLAKTELPTG